MRRTAPGLSTGSRFAAPMPTSPPRLPRASGRGPATDARIRTRTWRWRNDPDAPRHWTQRAWQRRRSAKSSGASSTPLSSRRRDHPALLDEAYDGVDALPCLKVGEDERPVAAHPTRVAVHDFQRRADQRREIDLVDHQEIGLGDSRAALARDLIAGGHVDHIERQVGKLR